MDGGAKRSCKGCGGIIASNFSTLRFSMRFRNREAISLVLCALMLRCIVGLAQRPCRSTVFVTVLDPNTNQPIDGLTASDFHPKFKGSELPIRALGASPPERRIVFVLDRSGSMTHHRTRLPLDTMIPIPLRRWPLRMLLPVCQVVTRWRFLPLRESIPVTPNSCSQQWHSRECLDC